MLDYVATRTELFGAKHDYEIFTAVVGVPSRAAQFLDRATVDDYYRDQAEEVLGPARAFAEKQGWRATIAHGVGHPPDAIAAHAESIGADLIVMGAHGHSAFGNVILGSTTNAVLARSKVPVLLIR